MNRISTIALALSFALSQSPFSLANDLLSTPGNGNGNGKAGQAGKSDQKSAQKGQVMIPAQKGEQKVSTGHHKPDQKGAQNGNGKGNQKGADKPAQKAAQNGNGKGNQKGHR